MNYKKTLKCIFLILILITTFVQNATLATLAPYETDDLYESENIYDELEIDEAIDEIENEVKDEKANKVENEVKDEIPIIDEKEPIVTEEVNRAESFVEIRVRQPNEQYKFLSGELIQFNVGASIDGLFPHGTQFEVKIPRQHIMDDELFRVSSISGQTPPSITRTGTSEDGYFIIRYQLNVLAGISFDAPIQMTTHNGNTPNGFEIPIIARLFNNDNGELLTEEIGARFTINTIPAQLSKRTMTFSLQALSSYFWSAFGAQNVFIDRIGLESITKPGYLSEDLRELGLVSFTYQIRSPGTFGNRTYEQLIFYDTIPDEALFIQEFNPGWTIDEETRTVRFERNINTMINQNGVGFGGSMASANFAHSTNTQIMHDHAPVLRLFFPGVQMRKTLASEARVVGRGLGTHCDINPTDCFDLTHTLSFSLGNDRRIYNGNQTKTPNENPATTSTNNVAIRGNRLLGEDTRAPRSSDTRIYTINVNHRVSLQPIVMANHLPMLPLTNLSIRDHSLDASLYFRGITIMARNATIFTRTSPSTYPEILNHNNEPGTLNVSVLLADGRTVMLAKNITITANRVINFSDFGFDPREVVEFLVEATEGSYLTPQQTTADENRIQISVHTGPRNRNELIIPPGATGRSFANSVEFSRQTLNHDNITQSRTGILAYRLFEPMMGLQHAPTHRRYPTSTGLMQISSAYHSYKVGERRHFRLDVNVMNISAGTTFETDQIFVLLPQGVKFVPGGVEFHNVAGTTTAMSSAQLNREVEVFPNYKDSGQTAILFHLRPFTRVQSLGTLTAPIRAFTILYEVEITENAIHGLIPNEVLAHMSWLNRDYITPAILPVNTVTGSSGASWSHRRHVVEDRFNLTPEIDLPLSEGVARVDIQPPDRTISIIKATPRAMSIMASGQPLTNMLGDEIENVLTILLQNMIVGDTVETNQIVDLLPIGMEFIPNSHTLQYFSFTQPGLTPINNENSRVQSSMTTESISPNIVQNYQGTGRTAVIFPLADIVTRVGFTDINARPVFRITYKTKITNLAESGVNTNEVFLSWRNQNQVRAGVFARVDFGGNNLGATGFTLAMANNDIVPDIWELTGDANNWIVRSRTTIHYTPPYELLMFKDVRGSKDANFLMYPASGTSELGTYVDFRIRLSNNSPVDIQPNDFLIVDILPRIGDGRGSTFNTALSDSITAPAGYRVLYTTDSIVTPEASVSWHQAVPDFSQVTAVRFEMLDGHRLERQADVAFEMRLDIPSDWHLTSDNIGVNTFHTSVNQGNTFIRSNHVQIRLFEFTVDGFVFHDLNGDGILQHHSDRVFPNQLVELVKMVSGEEMVVDHAYTNSSGFFSFKTLHLGEYLIRIHAPDGFRHIKKNIGGMYGANRFINSSSDTFNLDSTSIHQRINAGFEEALTPPTTGLAKYNSPLAIIGLIAMAAKGYIMWHKKKLKNLEMKRLQR